MVPKCVVCFRRSSLFCLVDQAFLCDQCDSIVHDSNTAAASHPRIDSSAVNVRISSVSAACSLSDCAVAASISVPTMA